MNLDELKIKYIPKLIGGAINVLGVVAPDKATNIALDIFRTPRKGRVESYQKKFLKKFEHRILSFDGMDVATYDNKKKGKKILLCHGWESNSFRWRKLYKEFAKTDYNVIMVDAPAHGKSGSDHFDAKIYAGFINAAVEHYQPEVLAGHSVGAYSVIYAMDAYNAPSVKKLIILASPDKFTDISDRYFNMIGLAERLRKRYFQVVEEKFGMPATYYNAADFASRIEAPALVIQDKEDLINLYYEAESIHSKFKDSKLVTTKGLGHSLQDPSVYNQVLEFMS